MTPTLVLTDRHGHQHTTTYTNEPLGQGGEGTVYPIPNNLALAIKLYHPHVLTQRGLLLHQKLQAMLERNPNNPSLAWPTHIITNETNTFLGYAMPRLDITASRAWGTLANTADRRKTAPGWTVKHTISAITNLATVFAGIHETGTVLGDVNESNVWVSNNTQTTIIDCDSFQITAKGTLHRSPVAKAEYVAPEFVGAAFNKHARTSASDMFALAILAFQALTGGTHPYDGIPTNPHADLPPISHRIAGGHTPYLGQTTLLKQAPRVNMAPIPQRVTQLLKQTTNPDPRLRPTATIFGEIFSDVLEHLVPCETTPTHYWDQRDHPTCLWCTSTFDPFSISQRTQTTQTPAGFNTPNTTTQTLKRRAPTRATNNNPLHQQPNTPTNNPPTSHSPYSQPNHTLTTALLTIPTVTLALISPWRYPLTYLAGILSYYLITKTRTPPTTTDTPH